MAAGKKQPIDDVAKPGKTPADATARPIITGHAMMQDPMVTKDAEEPVATESTEPTEKDKELAAPSAAHKVIQPLAAQEEAPKEAAKSEEDKPAEEEKTDEPSVSDDAVVDAVLEQVGDKKQETKQSEEDRKRQELVDKLVEEKKYFVPIAHEAAKRNSKLALIILGALLPLIIGLGLAADAGLVDLGFKMPFDFIKDKQTTSAPLTTTPTPQAQTTTQQPTTKKLAAKVFDFSITYPSKWTATDESVSNDVKLLDVKLNDGDATYALGTVTGKGGDCTPAKKDVPYAKTNACPTYEELSFIEATNGYLVTTKYGTPNFSTTQHLCFRPKVGTDGQAIKVTKDQLNKPQMGFVLHCGPDDINIVATKDGKEVSVFDQKTFADLQTALKTISIDYSK